MLRHPIWRPADAVGASSPLGVASSAFVHLALIAVSIFFTREPGHYAKDGSTELVRFLIPVERVPTHKIEHERVEYRRIGIPDGWGISDVAGELAGSEIHAAPRRGERGQDPELDRPHPREFDEILGGDQVFSALEVDSTVARSPDSAAPYYPAEMLAQNVEGAVRTRYIVDPAGHIDTTTFEILEASHPAFAAAVLEAMPRMRFRPAISHGRRVSQLVEQTFEFRVARRLDKVSLRAPSRDDRLDSRYASAARHAHAT